jgi:hypothetical protein
VGVAFAAGRRAALLAQLQVELGGSGASLDVGVGGQPLLLSAGDVAQGAPVGDRDTDRNTDRDTVQRRG